MLEAVRVDADDPAVPIEHRGPRGARTRGRGVLQRALDRATPRPAERLLGRRHLAPGGATAVAPGCDRDDHVARRHGATAPLERRGVAGVDVEHDEVAVDVAAGDRALRRAPVGEARPRSCRRAGCGRWSAPSPGPPRTRIPRPSPPDRHHRGTGRRVHRPHQLGQLVDCGHRILLGVTIESLVTLHSGRWSSRRMPSTPPPAASATAGACASSAPCSMASARSASSPPRSTASPRRSSPPACAHCRACRLITATPYERRPVRMRYGLTEPGRRLGAVIASLAEWGATREGHGRSAGPPGLRHARGDPPVVPDVRPPDRRRDGRRPDLVLDAPSLREVSGHLVGSAAFKAVGTGDPRPAGSIPVHLRHASTCRGAARTCRAVAARGFRGWPDVYTCVYMTTSSEERRIEPGGSSIRREAEDTELCSGRTELRASTLTPERCERTGRRRVLRAPGAGRAQRP